MFRSVLLAALLLLASFSVIAAEVDINSADAQTLQQLNGIGPVKAEAIVDYRESNGAFSSVEDLKQVDGIGAATLESNREQLTVN